MDKIQRYLVEEFVEEYKAGRMPRRDLLKRISLITGAAASAGFLAQLGVPEHVALAQTGPDAGAPQGPMVSPDDPELVVERVTFPGEGVTLMGYAARPAGDGPFAGVLVVHDNRAVSPYTQDVVRRAAKSGFAALSVDLVSREGGTDAVAADDPARVPGILGSAGEARHLSDLQTGTAFLSNLPYVRDGGVGVVGFCFGGNLTWALAVRNPSIVATAPFYGQSPSLDLIPNLAGPVMAVYGQADSRITAGVSELIPALQQAQKVWSIHIYAGAQHAFHNDTDRRYHPAAAQDAWAKTIDLFNGALPQA